MIQQLDLSGALNSATPLATIAEATRQKQESDQRMTEGQLNIQKLKMAIEESKKEHAENDQIKAVIAQGGDPQEVYQKLLPINPDKARAYLTNSQADTLQAQDQAMKRKNLLEGSVAPEVTAATPQTTTAPIQTSLTDPSQVSTPQVSAPGSQQVPLPLPKVSVPFIGQPATTVQPQSQQQLTLAERARQEFAANLEARKKASEPFVIPKGASVLQNGVITTPNAVKESPKVNFSNSGIPYSIIGPDKTEYVIGDPNMPADLKKLTDAAVASHAQSIKEEIDKETRLNANRADLADEAARKAELRAAQKAGNDPRVANVPEADRGKAYSAVLKAEDDLANAKAASDRMTTVLQLAKSGNKEAQASAALVGVQAINELANVKRVNQAEISTYGNAGSLIDRLEGKLGKLVAGKPIPDDVLADMQALHDAFGANADKIYDRKIQGVDKTFRSTFGGAAISVPIVQHSPSTGAYRYSTDGGKTWLPGQPPK